MRKSESGKSAARARNGRSRQHRPGRVVGTADDHQVFRLDPRGDEVRIEAKSALLAHRHGLDRFTGQSGRPRIVDIGRDRDQHPAVEQDAAQQIEQFGRTVGDDDRRERIAAVVGNGGDEIVALGIGIVAQVLDAAADDAAQPFRRPQRIDIGAEVDDPGGLHPAAEGMDVAAMSRTGQQAVIGAAVHLVSPFRHGACSSLIGCGQSTADGQGHGSHQFAQFTDCTERIAGGPAQTAAAPSRKQQHGAGRNHERRQQRR